MTDISEFLCAELRRNLAKAGRPTLPAGGEFLWRWFCGLSAARRIGFSGPEPITFAEIEAYARLTGWPIAPRHIAILQAMDATFLAFCREERERASGKRDKVAPTISSRPLSAAVLDAMFG